MLKSTSIYREKEDKKKLRNKTQKKQKEKKKTRKIPPHTPQSPLASLRRGHVSRRFRNRIALKCPQYNSTNTKFCYFNNYSLSQPRYLQPRAGPFLGGGHLRPRRSRGPRRSHGQQQWPRKGEDLGNKKEDEIERERMGEEEREINREKREDERERGGRPSE